MVNEPIVYKIRDTIVLSATPFLTGGLIFGAQFFGNLFFDMTHQLLPKSLETYMFMDAIVDGFGLGILGLIFAFLISHIVPDKYALDNVKQMILGLVLGLIVTIGLSYLDLFTMGQFVQFGLIMNFVALSGYAVMRFSN